jgi:hypothetical protein
MANRRAAAASRSTGPDGTGPDRPAATEAIPTDDHRGGLPEWMAQAAEQGIKPEQALAFIGLGLMRKLASGGPEQPWIWSEEEDGGKADLTALRAAGYDRPFLSLEEGVARYVQVLKNTGGWL